MSQPITLFYKDYFISEDNSVTVARRNSQKNFPLHNHNFDEIVIISAGNGIHIWNNQIHPITCGDLLYIRHDDIHSYEDVDQLKLDNILYRKEKLFLISMIQTYLPLENSVQQERLWRINSVDLQKIQLLIDQLELETTKTNQSSIHLAEGLFLQLLILLCRFRHQPDDLYPDAQKMDNLFTALCHSIDVNFDLEAFCLRNKLSPRSIRRLFKQQTNMTIGQYLQKLRLCKAMTLLRNTTLPIVDIALQSGYEDSNYFSSVFRKESSCTPSEYRARFKKNVFL